MCFVLINITSGPWKFESLKYRNGKNVMTKIIKSGNVFM